MADGDVVLRGTPLESSNISQSVCYIMLRLVSQLLLVVQRSPAGERTPGLGQSLKKQNNKNNNKKTNSQHRQAPISATVQTFVSKTSFDQVTRVAVSAPRTAHFSLAH